LENETIAVLKNFVFKYNTPEVRADLVTKITPIWQRAQTSGAIAWFTIQCDDKNNTEEIIAEDYGIIDVTCEMNRGMEKIVQRIHVTRNSVYLVGNSVRMS
jgi:phage tail sheath protein FI